MIKRITSNLMGLQIKERAGYCVRRKDLENDGCPPAMHIWRREYGNAEEYSVRGTHREVMAHILRRALGWPWGIEWAQARKLIPELNLVNADLSGMDLRRVYLRGRFEDVSFCKASLLRADLRHAEFVGCDFAGARLDKARLPDGFEKHIQGKEW